MSVSITTRYESHPGSNVGAYRARALGRTAKVRTDQALSSEENHREAAWALTRRLRDVVQVIPTRTTWDDLRLDGVEDDGRHVWSVG